MAGAAEGDADVPQGQEVFSGAPLEFNSDRLRFLSLSPSCLARSNTYIYTFTPPSRTSVFDNMMMTRGWWLSSLVCRIKLHICTCCHVMLCIHICYVILLLCIHSRCFLLPSAFCWCMLLLHTFHLSCLVIFSSKLVRRLLFFRLLLSAGHAYAFARAGVGVAGVGLRFEQIPQLSTSRQIDVNDKFSLRNTGVSKRPLCALMDSMGYSWPGVIRWYNALGAGGGGVEW